MNLKEEEASKCPESGQRDVTRFSLSEFSPEGGDINPRLNNSNIASQVVHGNSNVFRGQWPRFVAEESSYGRNSWSYDGAQIIRATDFQAGPAGSGITKLEALGEQFFFMADDGVHDLAPWSCEPEFILWTARTLGQSVF